MEFVKEFEISWRQYFLDTMKPKFLPQGWDVYHNHERIDAKLKRENDRIEGAPRELDDGRSYTSSFIKSSLKERDE